MHHESDKNSMNYMDIRKVITFEYITRTFKDMGLVNNFLILWPDN